ncbi:MAG: DUF542 domain-containing protein [Chthoniobacterales bacterium]
MYFKYSFNRLTCQSMKNVTPETSVGEIVRAFPARSRIFENLGIDYCCGGKKSLGEACKAKGLDPRQPIASSWK